MNRRQMIIDLSFLFAKCYVNTSSGREAYQALYQPIQSASSKLRIVIFAEQVSEREYHEKGMDRLQSFIDYIRLLG